MAFANSQNSLLILGVHLKSEGYPNTLYRIRDLETSGIFNISEINVPMWSKGTQKIRGFSCLMRNAWRVSISHIMVMIRYLAASIPERVYVPYPAVFVVLLISLLPARYRPRYIVLDAFISLYDTVVLDRQLIKQNGLLARILKRMEQRAYAFADKLVVDTAQNAKFLSSLFNLSDSKFVVIPLSTDEIHFKFSPYLPSKGVCRVLFVGTMVPLHGIETILGAASLISDRPDIHFKLIGDGQDSTLVEDRLTCSPLPNLEWERSWQSSKQIAEEISRADICLGIFGAGDKTQRVCPFKIYAYASMGRSIITAETEWLKDATNRLSSEPFIKVPVNDAAALAAMIVQLADDSDQRIKLARISHEFYLTHFCNSLALERLTSCLLGRK